MSAKTTATRKQKASKLTLIESSRKVPTAPILRVSIIEGTGGEDAGPYPPLPKHIQMAVDKKARILADGARDLIRESIVREIGCHCFYGAHYENFDADEALEIVKQATLDGVLAPIARHELEHARDRAEMFLSIVKSSLETIDRELRRLDAEYAADAAKIKAPRKVVAMDDYLSTAP